MYLPHSLGQAISVSEKQAIELVKSLTKLTLDEIDCYDNYNGARDFTNLFEQFFTKEFTHLIFWGKHCPGYNYKPNEIRADTTFLIGTTILFGEFPPPRNDGIPIWKYRELNLSAKSEQSRVMVTARYKVEHIPTWTKFIIIPTPLGPRIDDIELKGAGNDYYALATPIKSMKTRLKKEYDCTQKKLKNCVFFD